MRYNNTVHGIFVNRPNRFIAEVEIDGKVNRVHVKNTGRCKELLLPGADVVLCKGDNPNRKTEYDLISVYKDGLGWVNIDSQVPNVVVKEWLESGHSVLHCPDLIRPEYTYGKSRVDFYAESEGRKCLIEVKGATLEIDGKGYFPDAPTDRGRKHLMELAGAVREGYDCYIAFVIAMPKVKEIFPNEATDPVFARAFYQAVQEGVKVLFLRCLVSEDEIKIADYELREKP